MTATYDWLRATLVKEYKLDPEKLTLDAPLDALGVDSLATAELLFNVEDAFGIVLPPEPVELPTVGDVVGFIDALILAQVGQAGAPASEASAPLPTPDASDAGVPTPPQS